MYLHFLPMQKSFPSIRLHVLLEDEDRLVFSPEFIKVQTELSQIIDGIVHAVQSFERLELKISLFQAQTSSRKCLKPVIADQMIEDCRTRIFSMLEEQRIGPELRMQDFDDYMSLMNGADADRIFNFMNDERQFEEYCELINHYNDIEHEICWNVWGVVSMGFYEFHRTSLIDTLEALARFMQTELLAKMVADQQSDMAKLQSEYEFISQQSLTIPTNTAELMSSKAYVAEMQSVTIPEMENRLRLVSRNATYNNYYYATITKITNKFPMMLSILIELTTLPLVDGPNDIHTARNQTK